MLTILTDNRHELTELAQECKIDWNKAYHLVNFNGRRISRGIEISKKYRGKVAMWCNTKVDKAGREFPIISFHTKAHGGITRVFSGFESIKDLKFERSFKPAITATPKPVEHKPDADEIKKQRYLETTLARFEKLPQEDGTHDYLTRKFGQRDASFYACDLRRDSNSIIYAIKDFHGKIIGFQQIFDKAMEGTNRDKNYIGSTSGGFIVIGDESRINTDGAFFTEGLATGLALFNAEKKRGYFSNVEQLPVVVCLDAGNLAKVVKTASIRGCKNVTIAADNDCENKNGNTGVYVAMKIAREIGAKVIIPSNASGTKCDFADTLNHSKHDYSKGTELAFLLELVKHAPKQQLKEISRKLAREIAKHCPAKYSVETAVEKVSAVLKERGFDVGFQVRAIVFREYNKIKNEIKKLHKITDANEFINHDLKGATNEEIARHVMESEGGFWYDNRGLGAGKTNMMIALNEMLPHDTCAYIVHRIALVKDACTRIGYDSYEDLEPRFYTQKMGICVNSIPKFSIHQRFRVLFIDEARQVLEHILSGAVENRQAVFDEFILAIQAADLIIVSDADLNDRTVKFFKKYGGNKSHNLIITEETKNTRSLNIIMNHDANMNNMLHALQADKNIIVASTSIDKAKSVATYFIEQGVPEELILTVHSENKADKKVADFLANPNAECVKYKAVIHSPTIGSGVSITTPHFAYNFLINCGNLPANEALQMTARNRCAKNVFVSFSEQKCFDRVTDIDLLVEGEGLKVARYMTEKAGGGYVANDLGQLRIDLHALTNADANNFANCFVMLAEINGMEINYDRAETAINWIEEEALKGLSGRVKDKTVDAIFNSEIITELTAEQLSEKSALTQIETNQLKRHLTTKMVGLDEIERDDVKNFVGGMMKILGLYEIFQAEPEELMAWDKTNHSTKDKRYSKVSLNRLLVQLFEVAASNGLVVTEKTAVKFCNALKNNAAELAANNMGNYNKNFKRPMQTMSIFLKRFGMELVKDGRNGNGSRKEVFLLKENPTISRYASNRAALSNT